ncbi:MAG: MFS transporter [Clostridia bacterium]|nr:MFS transporter [Clostridia bacterium]
MAEKIQLDENLRITKVKERNIKRNMGLYTAGSAVSSLGTYMYNFAIGLFVLKLTGSGASFALAILFGMVPRIILSPFAGALADKLDRKKMVVIMDLLSGFLMLGVFLLTRVTALTLPIVYFSSAMLTIFNTFFGVALGASVPNLVDEKRLMKINSFRSTIDSSTSLVGPLLGGIVYAAIGIQYFLLLNGLSFVCSGISEMFIDFNIYNRPVNHNVKAQSMLASMKEGILYLKEHKLIKGIMKYVLFLNFIAMSLTISLPFTSVEVLKATPQEYGIVQMGFPLGMLVMSILYGIFKKDHDKIFQKTAKNTLLFGVIFMLFGLPSSPIMMSFTRHMNLLAIGVISFVMGTVIIAINIPLQVMMQKSIDDQYRGRVGGVISMAAQSISPLGLILFGFMIDHMSSYLLPVISGIMIVSIAFLMLTDKKMMEL